MTNLLQDPMGKFYIARSIYKTILQICKQQSWQAYTWFSRWLPELQRYAELER